VHCQFGNDHSGASKDEVKIWEACEWGEVVGTVLGFIFFCVLFHPEPTKEQPTKEPATRVV